MHDVKDAAAFVGLSKKEFMQISDRGFRPEILV